MVRSTDLPTLVGWWTERPDGSGFRPQGLVAVAAYAIVAAALDLSARAGGVGPRVSVTCVDETLAADIEIAAVTREVEPDLVDVADRVGAIGGELTVSTDEGAGVWVRAVIPCGS